MDASPNSDSLILKWAEHKTINIFWLQTCTTVLISSATYPSLPPAPPPHRLHRNVGITDNIIIKASTNLFTPTGLRTPRKSRRFTFKIDASTQGLVYQWGLLATSSRKYRVYEQCSEMPSYFCKNKGQRDIKRSRNPKLDPLGLQSRTYHLPGFCFHMNQWTSVGSRK